MNLFAYPPLKLIRQYADYVSKTVTWLNRLSKDEHLSLAWVYYDYAMSVVRHRCLIRQYVIGGFWKLSNPERRRRLTYSRMVKLFDCYNASEYVHLLNNKPEFNAFFREFVHRDWLYVGSASRDEFEAFVVKHDAVIIKPVGGVEGVGVRKFVLSSNPGTDMAAMYEALKREDVMVEQIIVQHPQMVFGNSSVNTIRVHTVLDSSGKAHAVKPILRAGVGNSVVDNYCQGGLIYEVDLATGIVCTPGQSKSNMKTYVHPGTNVVMLGYKIPNWDVVIRECERAAESLPQVRIIGWDVAVTASGVELIEGNHNPDYELFEFMGSRGYYWKIKELLGGALRSGAGFCKQGI